MNLEIPFRTSPTGPSSDQLLTLPIPGVPSLRRTSPGREEVGRFTVAGAKDGTQSRAPFPLPLRASLALFIPPAPEATG